jgi:hypothetical protein
MNKLAAIAAMLLAAGAAVQHAHAQNQKRTPDAPLDFDPAKPERIDGWWTNGTELMRLDTNGAYRLWVSQDRFKYPVEVGAWRRTNYVYFDLEPYRAKPGTRHRVNLEKSGTVTELSRDGMKPFRWLPTPPRVMSDEMLGAWVSPTEQLLVLENGRYEWRRTGPAQGISEHSGSWNGDGDVLTLGPDTTAVDQVSLRCVKGADGQWTLEGRNGRMTRPPLDPAPPPAPGSPVAGPASSVPPTARPDAPASAPPPPAKPSANG